LRSVVTICSRVRRRRHSTGKARSRCGISARTLLSIGSFRVPRPPAGRRRWCGGGFPACADVTVNGSSGRAPRPGSMWWRRGGWSACRSVACTPTGSRLRNSAAHPDRLGPPG